MVDFSRLTFDDFKRLACDDSLSIYEKIGFNDEYREEYTKEIIEDIIKYTGISIGGTILDIGPGCSDVAKEFINMFCSSNRIILLDSREMLDRLPDNYNTQKIAGMFPIDTSLPQFEGKIDTIIVYSVLQHVCFELNPFTFIDKAVKLLSPGGSLFLGDIPNVSKKLRKSNNNLNWELKNTFIEKEVIDDGLIFAILMRYRNFGYETYLVPHNSVLPLRFTRDNILIVKKE